MRSWLVVRSSTRSGPFSLGARFESREFGPPSCGAGCISSLQPANSKHLGDEVGGEDRADGPDHGHHHRDSPRICLHRLTMHPRHHHSFRGSFSAGSTPIFASKYAIWSIFQDLQENHLLASKFVKILQRFSTFCNFFRNWIWNSQKIQNL